MPTVGGDRGGSTVGTPDNPFGNAGAVSDAILNNLRPSGVVFESISRVVDSPFTTTNLLTSQRLNVQAVYLPAFARITNITYFIGGVAAIAPANWWFALYDSGRNLLRQTADQGAAAIPADTPQTLALSSPFVTVTAGLYYCGIMVNAGTVPQPLGNVDSDATIRAVATIQNGRTADAALTTTAPNPFTTPLTSFGFTAYCQGT